MSRMTTRRVVRIPRHHLLVAALVALSMTVTGRTVSAQTAAAPVDTIMWSQVTAAPSYWPIYIAEAKGFFTEQRIAMDTTVIASGAGGNVAALVSNSVDVSGISLDGVFSAVDAGANIVIVGGLHLAIADLQIVASPEITSPLQLKGKTCGATNLGKTSEAFYLKIFLEKAGLNYPADYTIVVAGAYAARTSALMAGQIQCVNVIEPFIGELTSKGYVVLGDSAQGLGVNYTFLSVVASKKFATERKDVLVRFLRALQQADAWLQDRSHEDEAIAILGAAGSQFRGVAGKRTYESFYVRASHSVEITPHDLLTGLKVQYQSGLHSQLSTNWQRYADLSYQEAAAKR